jgi:hypothetical protein
VIPVPCKNLRGDQVINIIRKKCEGVAFAIPSMEAHHYAIVTQLKPEKLEALKRMPLFRSPTSSHLLLNS